MNLLNFISEYPKEDSCKLKFKAIRDNDQVSSCISDQFSLITDDSTSYVDFASIVKQHKAQIIHKENIGKVLPWVHITISNTKRIL